MSGRKRVVEPEKPIEQGAPEIGVSLMKINPLSSYAAYGMPARVLKKGGAVGPEPSGKGDVISISREGAGQKEIGRISQSVLQELRRPADPVRLGALRAAVADNTYFVSGDQLADAILGRAVGV